jgi:hypothetical protein
MENNKELQDELVNGLNPVYDSLVSVIEKFSDDQINTVPFEGSWTPGQVADHIIKATGGIPDKTTAPVERPFNEKVAPLEAAFLNFDQKMKSPDFVLPGNGPFVKSELVQQLQTLKAKHAYKILNKDLKALCLDIELPYIGTMTRFEWFKFLIVHSKRHLYQLNNIHKVMQ